jgi:pimeloyl-ACP methyl ester carboxylesterase
VKEVRLYYWLFVGLVLALVVVAAIPVIASDLFRQPYSPAWPVINRTLARLHYSYNPSSGGLAPRFPNWHDPADANLYYRDVTLTTADGLHLAGWYVPVAGADVPTVLLCHGLQDQKWTMLRLIPWLHDASYNVLLFDFRGHGGSDLRPTTIGPEEVLDVQSALDWLDSEGAGEKVAGLGMSLGAAALVNTAARDNRLDALILDSLFADWSDVDYAQDYRLPPDWLVPGVPAPSDLLAQVHVPVLIIHGTADNLVHVDHAQRLYAAANEPKALWTNDSGHAWSAWTYPEIYSRRVLDFLRGAFSQESSANP